MKVNKYFKNFLCVLLTLTLLFTYTVPASASTAFPESWPSAPQIASETGIVMERSTGQVIYNKNMDQVMYPASTTKVLTTLLILENVEDLNAKITFTDIILPDLEPGNSTINAKVGEELTVEQCLYAILLASANEVCTQMAVYTAGSVENFTAMMNQKAQDLGCTNTHFTNANGLPDPDHYSSAHDLALILKEAIKNEKFCEIAGAAIYTIPPTNMTSEARNLENHHLMMIDGEYHYDGIIAGKTGHTEAAGDTLVTAAQKEDLTLICVVMRSENNERFTDTASLLDYGFNNFHKEPLYWLDKETPVGYAILPKEVSGSSLTVEDTDTENTRTRTYSYQGMEVFKASTPLPIKTKGTSNVEDNSIFKVVTHKTSTLLFPLMMVVLILLIGILIALIVRSRLEQKRRKKRKKKKSSKKS